MIDKEKYRTDGEFIGSSGTKLNQYYDFMGLFNNINDLHIVMLEVLTGFGSNREHPNIIGVETFGAMAVAWENGYCYTPSFLLKPRDHGNRERFRGEFDKYLEHTILLDDVITTGGTISEALSYLLLHEDILVNEVVVLKSKLKEIDGYKIRVVGD